MADLTERNIGPVPHKNLTEKPYENIVCNTTLICALSFLAACFCYMITPDNRDMALDLVYVTGGIFGVALIVFFASLFMGKLPGHQD